MTVSTFLYQILDGGIKEKGLDEKTSLDIARKAGIKNADINAAFFDAVPVEKVKEMLESCGMTMCVHSARWCDFSDENAYLKSLDVMKNDLLTAKKGGSKYLMAVPLMQTDKLDCNNKKQREYFFRLFGELAHFCKENGICVTVENYSDKRLPYTTISDIKQILDSAPDLYFNLDTGNFTLSGQDELEGALVFLPKTVNVHLKDVKETENGDLVRDGKRYEITALGDGTVRNAEIIKLLKSANYRGYLTAEVASPLFDKTMRSVEYIRNILSNISDEET